jgi:hypothetical protein
MIALYTVVDSGVRHADIRSAMWAGCSSCRRRSFFAVRAGSVPRCWRPGSDRYLARLLGGVLSRGVRLVARAQSRGAPPIAALRDQHRIAAIIATGSSGSGSPSG